MRPANQPSLLTKLLCRVAFKPLPYHSAPIVAPDPSDQVIPGVKMPTWDGVIAEEDYAPLAAYVRKLGSASLGMGD